MTIVRAMLLLGLLATRVIAGDPYDDTPGSIFDQGGGDRTNPAQQQGAGDASSAASTAPTDDRERARRDEQVWPGLVRRYTAMYVFLEGASHALTRFDKRYPSSLGQSVDGFLAEQSRAMRVGAGGGLVRTLTIAPPREDAELFVKALPRVAVGEYGRLHSAVVEAVLGAEEMVLSSPWWIDALALRRELDRQRRVTDRTGDDAAAEAFEQRHALRMELMDRQSEEGSAGAAPIRVVGFSTKNLVEGQRWHGPLGEGFDLVIVALSSGSGQGDRHEHRRRSREYLLALPVDRLPAPITEEHFKAVLTEAGMTPSTFVDLVFEQTRLNPRDVEPRVLVALERARDAARGQKD